jgi:hypothetical protein
VASGAAIAGNAEQRAVTIEMKKNASSGSFIVPDQVLHQTERVIDRRQKIPHDPDFEETLKIADQVMDEYKDTLVALARSPVAE